jgi:hypothetical protein
MVPKLKAFIEPPSYQLSTKQFSFYHRSVLVTYFVSHFSQGIPQNSEFSRIQTTFSRFSFDAFPAAAAAAPRSRLPRPLPTAKRFHFK